MSAEPPTRRRRGKGLDREELEARYPSLKALSQPSGESSKAAWVAVFTARPDAMASLLADFIKQVYAQPGRIGQRPMPHEEQVDLQSLLYPEENTDPLGEVLRRRMVSERDLARRTHLSKTQLRRILTGQYLPDVPEMRNLAAAIGKPPTYFVEYRKAMALTAVVNLLDDHPGLATTLYRRYLEVRTS